MKENNQRLVADLTPAEKKKIKLFAIKNDKTITQLVKEFILKLEVN
jgi:hypothetical protein